MSNYALERNIERGKAIEKWLRYHPCDHVEDLAKKLDVHPMHVRQWVEVGRGNNDYSLVIEGDTQKIYILHTYFTFSEIS